MLIAIIAMFITPALGTAALMLWLERRDLAAALHETEGELLQARRQLAQMGR